MAANAAPTRGRKRVVGVMSRPIQTSGKSCQASAAPSSLAENVSMPPHHPTQNEAEEKLSGLLTQPWPRPPKRCGRRRTLSFENAEAQRRGGRRERERAHYSIHPSRKVGGFFSASSAPPRLRVFKKVFTVVARHPHAHRRRRRAILLRHAADRPHTVARRDPAPSASAPADCSQIPPPFSAPRRAR